jgi:hypothetical protein
VPAIARGLLEDVILAMEAAGRGFPGLVLGEASWPEALTCHLSRG